MAKAIFDYWFVQYDFPNEEGKPYKSSGGKMIYREVLKRSVPIGWKVAELRDYLRTNRGVSYSGKEIINAGVPMINLNSFNTDGTFKIQGTKSFSGIYSSSKILKPYDLVMCNTQQTALDPQKDIIGKTFLVPDIFKTEIISSHHVTTINVNEKDLKFYLYKLFNIDYCVKATTAASHNMYFLQYSIFTTSANVTHRRDKNKGHAERAIVFCFSAMGVQP